MNYDFSPFLRYIKRSDQLIENKSIVAPDARILFVISGRAIFKCQGSEYPLKSGTLLFYPYDKPYGFYENQRLEFYTLNFDFTHDHTGVPTMRPKAVQAHDPSKVLRTASVTECELFDEPILTESAFFAAKDIEDMYEEEVKKDFGYRAVQSALLKKLLIRISRNALDGTGNGICAKIKEYVHSDPGIRIKEIAGLMSYHPYYLNEIFKMHEGTSLHKYLASHRLGIARDLIANTDLTLAQIAERCCFSSPSHLSAAFKEEYGISPSQIRKESQNKKDQV